MIGEGLRIAAIAAIAVGCALPSPAGATVSVRKSKTITVKALVPATQLTLQARTVGCSKHVNVTFLLNGKRLGRTTFKSRKLRVLIYPVTIRRAGKQKLRIRLRSVRKPCRLRIGMTTLGGPAPAAKTKRAPSRPLPDPATAPKRKVPLGAAMEWRSASWWMDTDYQNAFTRNFDGLTPENVMKMEYLEPEQGKFDFNYADSLMEFAEKNGKSVRGHALVWHQQLPRWITSKRWNRDALNKELELYIKTVVGHYRGRIAEWDVANEVFNEDGSWRDSVFYEALGPDFVANALRWAHEADPSAKLYINDFNIEYDRPKAAALEALVRKLKAEGVPLDGVGLQMHWDEGTPPSAMDVQSSLRRYTDLGVDVQITEMDVAIDPAYADDVEHRENQALQYEAAALACNAVVQCTKFTVWGVSDKYTWRGSATVPLLLDAKYGRKSAYDRVRGAFAGS